MIIEKDGKKYLRVGDKAIPISSFDKDGKPVIKAQAKEVTRGDGRVDVVVDVPVLQIVSKKE